MGTVFWILVALGSFLVSNIIANVISAKRRKRISELVTSLLTKTELSSETRIPITIVTGFLGSGKTTLLNRILTELHNHRIAIIENEVGDIPVDHLLLNNKSEALAKDGVFVMKNGCLCCRCSTSSESELESVLRKLDILRKNSSLTHFDHVLIETTGLADPVPILHVLHRHELNEGCFYSAGIVTVVDGKNLLRDDNTLFSEVEHQVGYADTIILNKDDLISPELRSGVLEAIVSINPCAPILISTHCEVDINQLLNVSIQYCVMKASKDILRIKGLISVSDKENPCVIQGIHSDVAGSYDMDWPNEEYDRNHSILVIIGLNLQSYGFDTKWECMIEKCKAPSEQANDDSQTEDSSYPHE